MESLSPITEVISSTGCCFVVDERLKVIGWSDSLARLRNVPATSALGQRCWEVRGGRRSARPPATCRSCPLLDGQTANNGQGGCCATLPLPRGMGAALVWPPEWGRQGGSAGIVPQLVVLGTLAATLTPDDLRAGLEGAVELLRRACAADDCELFLREPCGGDMVLAACCGRDRDALMSRERFPIGTGYPGIVGGTGRPLLTPSLPEDGRFLRRAVAARGIRCYVCVPVPGVGGPMGSVSLAWRRPDVPIERAADLLSHVSAPIGTTVRAGLAGLRESVDGVIDSAGTRTRARYQAFLQEIMRASGARSASMILGADSLGGRPTVLSAGAAPSVCGSMLVDGVLRCGFLEQGHGMVLGACRGEWPEACRKVSASAGSRCCLPMQAGDLLRGAVVLDYDGRSPAPLNRDLVPLLAMVREAAARLAAAKGETYAGRAAPALELRCFGGLEVRVHGETIPADAFARKNALALLKMLVLKAGNPIGRDVLIERFWPGADPKAGANRLHGVVHALRSAIEPHRRERRWIYVCNQGEFYYFNMESPHWIDIYAFRRHAADASRALETDRTEEAVAHLEKALALYCGDLFEDDPYSDWYGQERVELKNTYLELVLRLAELSSVAGDMDRSIEYLRRGLRTDPLREDIHQALIQTLADSGRRHEALQQYRDCERVLRKDLGVEPMPATQRLGRLLAP